MPASPIAWISSCQPRPVGLGGERIELIRTPTRAGRSTCRPRRASSIAAVRASMTPSAKAFRIPTSSHGPPRRSAISALVASRVRDHSSRDWSGRIWRASRVRKLQVAGRPASERHSGSSARLGPGILDRGDARGMHRARCSGASRPASRPRTATGCAAVTRSWAPSLSAPVGSPRRRVADDDAVSRVRRVAIDAGEAQRRAVDPAGVAVVAAHERRPVRHDRIELLACRQAARERDVHPAAALDPGVVRCAAACAAIVAVIASTGRELEEVRIGELLGAADARGCGRRRSRP